MMIYPYINILDRNMRLFPFNILLYIQTLGRIAGKWPDLKNTQKVHHEVFFEFFYRSDNGGSLLLPSWNWFFCRAVIRFTVGYPFGKDVKLGICYIFLGLKTINALSVSLFLRLLPPGSFPQVRLWYLTVRPVAIQTVQIQHLPAQLRQSWYH